MENEHDVFSLKPGQRMIFERPIGETWHKFSGDFNQFYRKNSDGSYWCGFRPHLERNPNEGRGVVIVTNNDNGCIPTV